AAVCRHPVRNSPPIRLNSLSSACSTLSLHAALPIYFFQRFLWNLTCTDILYNRKLYRRFSRSDRIFRSDSKSVIRRFIKVRNRVLCHYSFRQPSVVTYADMYGFFLSL